MLTKILAASAFTIALATSAMAQSNSAAGADGSGGSGKSVTVDPSTPASPNTIDPGATNSITTMPGDMNSNADQNCPTNPQGAQTDANGNATAPTVNDKNCGK
ncbi:hypothetical protein FJW08_06655 [Mesorhizobium sp. B3-2-1]|uniref:hypothetical protein n=1 Tax=unclassified Mesorhizobium TaxID=325217 RepID=UPI001127EDBC|nr:MULTISPECIES: hypothetical protein [unclassified Mesorhizobium]MBZ9670730.1 hypothetical protein [Mesorhizobium sp. ES1-3]TPI32871.1 hypothetical protein FJW08_06655 [Mesorhizobium sp. B3-2-1]